MVFCEAEVFKVVFCEADGVAVCKEYKRSACSTASIITFADSCDVKILVVMFGVLFGSLTGLLGGVTLLVVAGALPGLLHGGVT